MKSCFSIIILLTIISAVPAIAQEDISIYEKAQELYRADDDAGSLKLFLQFLSQNPDSVKADDSRWYIGRIYRNLGKPGQAEKYFLSVLTDAESNRRTEAFYDLAKLWDGQDREEKVVQYAMSVIPENTGDSYAVRALPVVLKSYSLTGIRFRGEGLGARAAAIWNEALDLIRLFKGGLSAEDMPEVLQYEAGFYAKLAETTGSSAAVAGYGEKINVILAELKKDYPDELDARMKVERDLSDISILESDFNYSVKAQGGYNGFVQAPGAEAQLHLSGGKEIKNNLFLGWKVKAKHDSFSFKTFNFDTSKPGDERYFQWKESFDGGVSLEAGSPYYFHQAWQLDLNLDLAQDPGDFNYGGSFNWNLGIPLGMTGMLDWENSFSMAMFPDYVSSGRELNNFKVSTSPTYTLVFRPGSTLDIGYDFTWKYYLNARYDTIGGGTDPDTRQYIINDLFLKTKTDLLSPFDFELGYSFEYLKSINYDLWVNGNPASLFIEDYFDYVRNSVDLGIRLKAGRFAGKLSAGFALRNFINYKARDASNNFTGDKRTDQVITAGLDGSVELMDDPKYGNLAIILNADLEYSKSNQERETTYLTNYLNWQVLLGLQWKD